MDQKVCHCYCAFALETHTFIKKKKNNKKLCFWQMLTLEENNISERDKKNNLRYGNKTGR